MKRAIAKLSNRKFDILIIGGGIYGVCAAWDATLRGLSVALVEQDDFGSATSSNSLKIIHGGLRYLQHSDLKRMRESIHERRILMKIAPHQVHPLPCMMPTYGHGMKGREVMAAALLINDLVGFDRNGLDDPQKNLPQGRTISREECKQHLPGIDDDGLTGGALWYDCQVYNSERLLLSFLHSAVAAGAEAANYVKVTDFLIKDNRILGVKAQDLLDDNQFEIRADLVINNSGPWVNSTLGLMNGRRPDTQVLLSKAMNLVIRRQLFSKFAVGMPSKFEFVDNDAVINKGSRLLFITPWRNYSLVGTTHVPYDGDPKDFRITEKDIQEFIDEVSEAYPAAGLTRDDVCYCYGGLLPMESVNPHSGDVTLVKKYMILDHKELDNLAGFMSVVGVKYTTARDVAAKSIDLAMKKLNKPFHSSPGEHLPVYGGDMEKFDDYLTGEVKKNPKGLQPEITRHLIKNYGTAYSDILNYLDEAPELACTLDHKSEVVGAEVIHGIREEMAQKLIDVVRRRTELGSAGNPGDKAIEKCAELMSEELGWDSVRKKSEIDETKQSLRIGDEANSAR